MKICPKCGMKAEDDVVFCSKCGTKFKDLRKTMKTQIIVLSGLICVLLAGCIVVGVLLYLKIK